MTNLSTLQAHDRAVQTLGTAELGDQRRTARLVQVAAQMAQAPDASLPQQMGGKRADLKAAYRLLQEADVTHGAVSSPPLAVHPRASQCPGGDRAVGA